MTNRLKEVFDSNQKFLSIYLTAGFPTKEINLTLYKKIIESGVKIIEVGFPCSDPIGDGTVIQDASTQSLNNGVTLKYVIETVKEIRSFSESTAIVLMGYFNQVFQYGVEKFAEDFSKAGADAVIIPDLPINEFKSRANEIFHKHNLKTVFLVTPETAEDRVREIDLNTTGFLYAVSSSSITGGKIGKVNFNQEYLTRLKNMQLKNKIAVGFGIGSKEDYQNVIRYADFAIIGSAFIKEVREPEFAIEKAQKFIKGILKV